MARPPIPFFGRTEELKFLRDRVRKPGLTVIEGPPQIGKSTLLRRIAAQLRDSESAHVGSADATGVQGEVFVRAAANAYQQWLCDAAALDRLRTAWDQREEGFPVRAASAIGNILTSGVSSLPGGGFVGETINQAFSGLVQVGDALETGGVPIGPIQSDEARSLISFIARDRSHPVVLILDQWEGSSKLEQDARMLERFLAEFALWPPVHILLHMRHPREASIGNPTAEQFSDHLVAANEPKAAKITIGRIDFEADLKLCDSLFAYLYQHVSGTSKLSQREVLGMIAGNPAVLERWNNLSETERADPGTLQDYAQRAHKYQYPEIEQGLLELLPPPGEPASPSLFAALRLSIVPLLSDPLAWQATKEQILGGCDESIIRNFASRRILDSYDGVPSFGLPERHEIARELALRNDKLRHYTTMALESLALDLAAKSEIEFHETEMNTDTHIRVSILAASHLVLHALNASSLAMRLASAARWLFGPAETQGLKAGAGAPPLVLSHARLISLAISNAIGEVPDDVSEVDQLLEELASIYGSHEDDHYILGRYVNAIYNSLHADAAESSRVDRRLDVLHKFSDQYPTQFDIQVLYANGLVIAFNNSGEDRTRANVFLDELLKWKPESITNAELRSVVAQGLRNGIGKPEIGAAREERLLKSLQQFAESNDNRDEGLIEFSKGLVNAFRDVRADSDRAVDLLRQLRDLNRDHGDIPLVRLNYAIGIFNFLNSDGIKKNVTDNHLAELHECAMSYPDDRKLSSVLLRALLITMKHETETGACVSLLNKATDALAYCGTSKQIKLDTLNILKVAARKLSHLKPGGARTSLDQAGDALWTAYQKKWPDQGSANHDG